MKSFNETNNSRNKTEFRLSTTKIMAQEGGEPGEVTHSWTVSRKIFSKSKQTTCIKSTAHPEAKTTSL